MKDTYRSEGYLNENYHYFHLKDTAGQERDFHFHAFDKLVILLSGKVSYILENEAYDLKPWDILLVSHHTIHKALIDKSQTYDRIIFYINRKYFDRILPDALLFDCFDKADHSGNHLVTPSENQRTEIASLIGYYERNLGDEMLGAQAMRDTLLMQLLIWINRVYAENSELSSMVSRRYDKKIEKVLSYINQKLTEDLNVDVLAQKAYMSRYHFMRFFKEQTGETVHAYIRQKRLMCAARLIREGVPSVKAAADSGFSDYSAFYRAFKESFGISPSQLKG